MLTTKIMGALAFILLVVVLAVLVYLCDAFVMPLDSDDWGE